MVDVDRGGCMCGGGVQLSYRAPLFLYIKASINEMKGCFLPYSMCFSVFTLTYSQSYKKIIEKLRRMDRERVREREKVLSFRVSQFFGFTT